MMTQELEPMRARWREVRGESDPINFLNAIEHTARILYPTGVLNPEKYMTAVELYNAAKDPFSFLGESVSSVVDDGWRATFLEFAPFARRFSVVFKTSVDHFDLSLKDLEHSLCLNLAIRGCPIKVRPKNIVLKTENVRDAKACVETLSITATLKRNQQ